MQKSNYYDAIKFMEQRWLVVVAENILRIILEMLPT